eukprot:Sspe_Gene.57135::Locus_31370_Transcript_1_1_Confidence_1.000_Length_664::g.57135::m.57135
MLSPGRRLFRGKYYGENKLQASLEQLNLILDFVGHEPRANDGWMRNHKPKEWLRKQEPRPAMDLRQCFPNANDDALDIMRRMLAFDPNKRWTARQCLEHPYFGEFAWNDQDGDEEYPLFDGSFIKKCSSSSEARQLVNLEIVSYHPEFKDFPGVELPTDVNQATFIMDESGGSLDEADMMMEEDDEQDGFD